MFDRHARRAIPWAILWSAGIAAAAPTPARREGSPRLDPGVEIQRGSPIPASKRPALDLESYGVSDNDGDILSFSDFLSLHGSTGYLTDTGDGYRWTTNSGSLIASMNMIPNGALVPLISVYYRDDSPTDDLEVSVCRSYRNFDGAHIGCFAAFQSQGTPGETHDFIVIPDTEKTFVRHRDIDGDGHVDLVSYEISVITHGYDGDVQIGAVRPWWFRQVSHPPHAPTFADVPPSDPAFQHIEALFSSGVTAGCGGSNYCPDAPLTRRQMAVFLARALGLHWPF